VHAPMEAGLGRAVSARHGIQPGRAV
jgi:hypothetical protein